MIPVNVTMTRQGVIDFLVDFETTFNHYEIPPDIEVIKEAVKQWWIENYRLRPLTGKKPIIRKDVKK